MVAEMQFGKIKILRLYLTPNQIDNLDLEEVTIPVRKADENLPIDNVVVKIVDYELPLHSGVKVEPDLEKKPI